MYKFFIVNCPILFCFQLFFRSTIIYFVFPRFICSPNFLSMFFIYIKVVISVSFFPIYTMSSAYDTAVSCSLTIFIPLRTISVLCVTFCNAKLNNIRDRESPSFSPVLFSEKDDSVPSILTTLLVFYIQ